MTIAVRNLTHRYGDTVAVADVSLTVADGEWLVLAGPNGSGKTTLVRHFNALLDPDAGEVVVDGRPAGADPAATRAAVGMVFQEPRDCFVAATVGADVAFGPENLGLDRAAIDRRVGRALAAVGMEGRADERIDALSGGERARVAVAGALAMEPAHLVLDEPFAGLDWPARRTLLARLADLHDDGRSLVVVTHDLRDVADRADRIAVLADGRIAHETTDARVDADRLRDLGVRPPPC
ncbi:MAG: energy-coupling factor ABC transporter ATP-binding protein [Haloferacaceae archaeon]